MCQFGPDDQQPVGVSLRRDDLEQRPFLGPSRVQGLGFGQLARLRHLGSNHGRGLSEQVSTQVPGHSYHPGTQLPA